MEVWIKAMAVGELKARFSEVIEEVMHGHPVAIGYGKRKTKVAVIVPYVQSEAATRSHHVTSSKITELQGSLPSWRYHSGQVIYVECFREGRLIAAQFQATGIPFHSRHDEADEWKPLRLDVWTMAAGNGFFRRRMALTNVSADRTLALNAVTPFAGTVFGMTEHLDVGRMSLAESGGLPYRIGWMRDNEWGQEGNFQWQECRSALSLRSARCGAEAGTRPRSPWRTTTSSAVTSSPAWRGTRTSAGMCCRAWGTAASRLSTTTGALLNMNKVRPVSAVKLRRRCAPCRRSFPRRSRRPWPRGNARARSTRRCCVSWMRFRTACSARSSAGSRSWPG